MTSAIHSTSGGLPVWQKRSGPGSADQDEPTGGSVFEAVTDLLFGLIDPSAVRAGESRYDAIPRVLGVEVVTHAYHGTGAALIAAARKYRVGYGARALIDSNVLAVVEAQESAKVRDILARIGLTVPDQSDGPSWLLLVSYD
jgi:hypothetical protein